MRVAPLLNELPRHGRRAFVAFVLLPWTPGCTETPSWFPDCVYTAPCDAGDGGNDSDDNDAPADGSNDSDQTTEAASDVAAAQ